MINPKPGLVKAVITLLNREYYDDSIWVIHEKASLKGNPRIDVVLDEMNGIYRKRTLIRVVHNSLVSKLDVKGVNEAAKKMSGRYVKITKKIFFIVSGTDTALVPKDFELRQIPGFSLLEKEVIRNPFKA